MTANAATIEGRSAEIRIAGGHGQKMLLGLSGHLDAFTVGPVWTRGLDEISRSAAPEVILEAGSVSYCDGAGATMIADFQRTILTAGRSFVIESFPAHYRALLDASLQPKEATGTAAPPNRGFVEGVGAQTVEFLESLYELVAYTGEVVLALGFAALHPARIRWKDTFRAMQQAGVMAFPVVVLVLFLIGLILAYQTAGTLHEYGADIYLADMLGISLLRELGPLMVAIMIAARSGSAFAAELGTMRVNEEVDALSTMGLEPVRFLVTPRVIAAVLVTPILTVFGNFAGLLGGLVVWVFNLGLPLVTYRNQLQSSLDIPDLLGGLGKSFVFGILIAAIGCVRGIQTRGGPASVGESATRAVVSGIVLIVLTDMVFGVVFFALGI